MAIFTDRLDQIRQAERIQRKGASKSDALKLKFLGYNKFGEKNTLGKFIGTVNPLAAMATREMAKGIVGGDNSSTGRAMGNTDKEFYAQKMSQLKFLAEAGTSLAGVTGLEKGLKGIGKTLLTGGANDLSALVEKGLSVDDPETSTSVSDKESIVKGENDINTEVFKDIPNINMANIMNTNKVDTPASLAMNKINSIIGKDSNPMETETGKELQELQEKSDIEDTKDQLEEDLKKKKKEVSKEDKVLDKIEKAIPVVGSLIDTGMKTKAYYDAEDREKKRQQSRKVLSNYNLL